MNSREFSENEFFNTHGCYQQVKSTSDWVGQNQTRAIAILRGLSLLDLSRCKQSEREPGEYEFH
jgi:hypothetical protein